MKREQSWSLGVAGLVGLAGWLVGSWLGAWAAEGPGDAAREQQMAELEQQIAGAEARRPAGPDDVFDSNLPLAKLQVAKLTERLQDNWRGTFWEKAWDEDMAAAKAALQRVAEGKVAYADLEAYRDQPYLERAYESQTDGSPQPYFVGVPEGYTPDRAWPLVLFLHGYVPDTSLINPWVLTDEKWELARREGVLFVLPHGRRNADFLGVGETDVLDVIREMQRYYRVDPERIYLTGASMGGYGCWAIALHYPDLFAAIGPISGQTDFFVWENRDRRQSPLFKSVLIKVNNPVDLAENALNLPSYCQHGGHDNLVPTIHSQLMTARLRASELESYLMPAEIDQARAIVRAAGLPELNYAHQYLEDDNYGHYIYWDLPCYERPLHWINTGTPDVTVQGNGPLLRVKDPPHVLYRTYSLKYYRAYWVQIDEFGQWAQMAQIDAQVQPGNRIEVVTENVTRYTLELRETLLDLGQPVTVVTNGQPTFTGPAPPDRRVSITLDGALPPPQPGERRKTPTLCGPAREAFNTPFLVTYSTQGGAADRQRGYAERFVQEWFDFAEGQPPVKADVDVTPEDRKKYNLVCFGEPATHAVLTPLSNRLPLGIEANRYRVGDEVFAGEDLGLVLLYPNPEQPDRFLLIFSGLYWGTPLPVNHKFDLLPDFIVFNDTVIHDGRDPINQHLIAGFFDQKWQLDPALIDRGPRP